jgi:hypothetical protein
LELYANISLKLVAKGTGFINAGGLGGSYHTVTGASQTYAATTADCCICCESVSVACTVNLPAPSAALAGKIYLLSKDTSAIAVAVGAAGGSVLGCTSLVTSAVHGAFYFCDGTNYYTVAQY